MENYEKARKLRREGKSIREINELTGFSKSSISVWVRDIKLTRIQQDRLSQKERQNRERFASQIQAMAKAKKEEKDKRYQEYYEEAKEIYELNHTNPLFMFLLGIYIGEGDKQPNNIGITNGDPKVIKASMDFFKLLNAESEKNRIRISIHRDNGFSEEEISKYWSDRLNVPSENIKVSYDKRSRTSKGKAGNRRPYGIAKIRNSDTRLAVIVKHLMEFSLEDY